MKKEKYITKDKGNYFRVRIRTPDGVFSKSVNIADYPSEAKALAAAKLIRDQALADRHANRLAAKSPTVESIYHKMHDMFGLSQKTIKRHDIMYRAAIAPYGSTEITDIKTSDVMDSITKYMENHSDQATDRVISLWSTIFETAQMLDIPVPNRAKAVKRTRPHSKVPNQHRNVTVTDEDIEAFLDALANYGTYNAKGRYRARVYTMLCHLMLHTGCRPAEAMALTKQDINLLTNEITINKAVGSTHTSSGQTIRSTKTEQSVRKIPIDAALKEMLIEYLEWQTNDYIFSDYDGSLLEIDRLSNHIHLVSKKIGIHVTLYMFRHKFSTDLLKVADLRTVQDLMGHESASMTLSYARSTEDDRKEAIDKRQLS